ncbi:MAG: LysE family transporter [Paludibacterium sp.]|uniref:LysE family transporter n=1 Tax=Paludibacterium sp. TaxID=1917523 RepID=UPI0025D2DEC0|nr:LysE family transporter [Paludibacterium sp.]MBV8048497.1 LysE family transporter [Paludibacterium sp.]MBV8647357.1 LysE family transporter [Paludibacterium sp.]
MNFLPHLAMVAAVMLLACISPGPDLIAVSSHGLNSRRAGLAVAAGIASSHAVWAALTIFGLGLLISQLAGLYWVIRMAGALYLLYLGVGMLRGLWRPEQESALARAETRGAAAAYKKGLTVGLTNPKAATFFGSLFVTLLPVHAPVWVLGMTWLSVVLVSIGWFSLVACLFSTRAVQQGYARLRKPIDAVMGTLLLALGARLALDH